MAGESASSILFDLPGEVQPIIYNFLRLTDFAALNSSVTNHKLRANFLTKTKPYFAPFYYDKKVLTAVDIDSIKSQNIKVRVCKLGPSIVQADVEKLLISVTTLTTFIANSNEDISWQSILSDLLVNNPALTSIDLGSGSRYLTRADLQLLANKCPDLIHIRLYWDNAGITRQDVMDFLCQCHHLTSLCLDDNSGVQQDFNLSTLADLLNAYCPLLIKFKTSNLFRSGIDISPFVSKLPNLIELSSVCGGQSICHALLHCPILKSLKADRGRISDYNLIRNSTPFYCIEALSLESITEVFLINTIHKFPNLKSLYLDGEITAAVIEAVGHSCPLLENIHIGGYTEISVWAFTQLKYLVALKRIEITVYNLYDSVIIELITHCPLLNTLIIDGIFSYLTTACFEYITQSAKHLTELSLPSFTTTQSLLNCIHSLKNRSTLTCVDLSVYMGRPDDFAVYDNLIVALTNKCLQLLREKGSLWTCPIKGRATSEKQISAGDEEEDLIDLLDTPRWCSFLFTRLPSSIA